MMAIVSRPVPSIHLALIPFVISARKAIHTQRVGLLSRLLIYYSLVALEL